MLTTSRGTLTTARGSPASSNSAPQVSKVSHFRGSEAQSLGQSRWRFRLESAPSSVDLVDYDGALLYEGLEPGFEWDGGFNVDLLLDSDAFCAEARIHIQVRA